MRLKTVFQYSIIAFCIGMLSFFFLRKNETVVYQHSTLEADVARLAFLQGEYELTKKYASHLQAICDQRIKIRQAVVSLIDQALEIKPSSKNIQNVFDKLVSIQKIDEVTIDPHAEILVLAKISAQSGFKGWESICRGLEQHASFWEKDQPELAALLYEISQFKVEDV